MAAKQTNSFFSNSIFIFLTRLFPSLATTAVLVLFSRSLPVKSYGQYQSIVVQSTIFNAIACLGIPSLVLTYPAGQAEYFFTRSQKLLLSGWIIALAFSFAMLTPKLPMGVAFAYMFTLSCTTIAESLLFSRREVKSLSLASVVYSLVFVGLHLYMMPNLWLDKLFGALVLLSVARLFFYFTRFSKPVAAPPEEVYDNFKSLWLHLGIYDVIQVLFRWVDKWFVAMILGSEVFAIYFNATIDIPFLSLALGAAGSAGLIYLAEKKHTKDTDNEDYVIQLMHQSGKILSCIVFPLFAFLALYRKELFAVVLSSKYESSIPIFLISILSVPVRAYSFTTVLQHFHRGGIINKGAILDLLVACALTYPLYKLWGMQGVAFSFMVSTYIQAAYYLYHSADTLNKPVISLLPLKNWLTKIICCAVLFPSIYWLTGIFSGERMVLFQGVFILALVVAIMLAIEIKSSAAHVNSSRQANI